VAVALLTAAALVGAIALVAVAPSANHMGLLALAVALAGTPTVLGLLVARRLPGHAMGPLLTLQGLVAALAVIGELSKAVAAGRQLPADAYVTAASQGAWVLLYVPVALLLLFFPDGRLTGRGGRWLLAAVLADAGAFMVLAATAPEQYLPPDESSPHVFGTMPGALANVLTAVTLPGLPVTLLLCLASVLRRFRAADGRRRRQFKWLALAGAFLPATLLAAWASYVLLGRADVVLAVGLVGMYLAVPTVIAIAILRPDLFEVDRVLASTTAHAAFTAGLLAVFTAANLAAGLLVGHTSAAAAAAATAVCAVVLAPLRGRLQRNVDRWLYPARKAAFVAIERLQRDTAAGRARPEQLEAVLRDALHDGQLRVGYLTPATSQMVGADGEPVDVGDSAAPVRLGGEQIGALSGGPRTSPDLLEDIATVAAPLVEVVRLRIELSRALREVEASRTRLLQVGYEQRARLERDLHDGAQQRLVSLGMGLRLAQRRLPRGGVDVQGLLDEAVAELGTAVSELRQVAHGIRPSCLDDGLLPALSGLVSSVPIPVTVRVTAPELADDIETTAYYVAAEAVTNAVKHSGATHIGLHVDARGTHLYVRVDDDGVGGAASRDGSGLAGLADRVGAHGGKLLIASPRGGGTTIEAVLPCAS
jgi:signal transduction histidine kinase